MKKHRFILVALFMLPQLLFTTLTFGQAQTVKGTVIDENGDPMIGVNVVIKGTTTGIITNTDGNYGIEASPDATLIFSFIGYNTEEITVGNQSVINVSLQPDVTQLQDIVVVGYGSMKKSDITGAVTSVKTEDMLKKAPTNVLEGIKGQAAGVVVTAQDGAPDANSAVYIRGIATINGTSKPLYVVDGVMVGNDANFLNPSDVESIEILKDASATAIYGSQGANGVIMITTKHGQAGKSQINFSANFSLQTLAKKLDVTDANQYGKNIRIARENDGNAITNEIFSETYDGKRKNIDWQDVMTGPALKQQYNLSASGGSENTQHSFSVGYLDHEGLVVNTNMNRITTRANMITKVGDFIEIGGDINFAHTKRKGSNANFNNNGNLSSLKDIAWWCPTMDYVDPETGEYVSPNPENDNGTYGAPIQGPTGTYDALVTQNILAQQMEQNGIDKNNKVMASAYANITFFKGLSLKSIASYTLDTWSFRNFYGNNKRYMPDGVTEIERYNYNDEYVLNINNGNSNNLGLETFITYKWQNDIHDLTLMAGNSIHKSFGEWSSAEAREFPAENIRKIGLTSDPDTRTGSGEYQLESRTLSYFGRATYSLNNRYILTGTLRRDGSSNFGVDNLWGTFPSAALAWRASEENFLKSNPIISNLKLRLGWGQTGNAGNIGNKATASLTSNTIQYFFYPQNGVAGLGTQRQLSNGYVRSLVDTRLQWETNEQSNIGIDLGLWNKSINLTVDYFTRSSKDLLLYQNIRPSAGYYEVYTNFGEISNKGIEFSLNYNKQLNRDWNISATLTGSTIKNEIKSIGVDQFFVNETASGDGSNQGAVGNPSNMHWDGHSIMRDGYAIGSFYGYEVEGIFQSQAEVDAANAEAQEVGIDWYQQDRTGPGDYKYKDLDGNGYIDAEDMTILGDGFPKLNYGLNLTAAYKNFDISVYSYGVYGVKINSYSAMSLSNMFGSDNGTVPNILNSASNEAWTPQNNSNSVTKLSILDYNRNMRGSDAWVKKGDYFKISTIQIGYNVGDQILSSLKVEGLRISLSVQNLLTISSYNEYGDPEIGQGDVKFTGLDTGRYPMPRTYTLGLNLQF